MAEMTAGILVACVPTFGPLMLRGRNVPSARPRDLPTIGSARMRPRRRLGKFDSLLSTLDRSHHDDEERGHRDAKDMEKTNAPTGNPVKIGAGTENGVQSTGGILVTRDLDVHSLNVPPRTSETSAL